MFIPPIFDFIQPYRVPGVHGRWRLLSARGAFALIRTTPSTLGQ